MMRGHSRKGEMMRTSTLITAALVLTGTFLSGCATTGNFTPVIDAAHTFELGKLSFSAPSGEGWEYMKDTSPPVEFVLFMKHGSLKPQGLMATVVEVRADSPVMTGKDLWDDILHPYREAIDAEKRFEILTTKCNDDDTFAKVGVLCFVEGRDYLATGTGQLDAVTIRGHGYAFVHPDDSSLIGVVEYFERGLPGKLSADTKKLVSEFAKSVTMRK